MIKQYTAESYNLPCRLCYCFDVCPHEMAYSSTTCFHRLNEQTFDKTSFNLYNVVTKLKEAIFMSNKNSITYCKVGDYYIPNLILPPEEAKVRLGKWGMMYKNYLLNYHSTLPNSSSVNLPFTSSKNNMSVLA